MNAPLPPPPSLDHLPPAATAPACPFCDQPLAARDACAACGRDPTARRRVCPRCSRMTPVAEPKCVRCGAVASSELPVKVIIIVAMFVVAFILAVIRAMIR